MDSTQTFAKPAAGPGSLEVSINDNQSIRDSDGGSSVNSPARRRGFRRRGSRTSGQSSGYSVTLGGGGDDDADIHRHIPLPEPAGGDWSVGDEVRMGLG